METTTMLSLRSSNQLLGLYEKAYSYQPANRLELTIAALELATSDPVDWKTLSANADKNRYPITADVPSFIQLRVPTALWLRLVEDIKNSFTPALKRTTTPYILKLLMTHYVNYLIALNSYEDNTSSLEQHSISYPEMAATLTEMMLTNAPQLEDIKIIMLNYKEMQNG